MEMNSIKKSNVDILLSTYNGNKYLSQLIISIINQTYKNWRLIIRDDGSTDDTIKTIQYYTNKFPDKLIYINDNYSHLGPCQSFGSLLDYTTADYIMFCDQDDVWLKNKIKLTLQRMINLENCFPDKPLLVHTDLTIVDKDMKVISESLWNYQKINPYNNKINNVLVQNIVTGCTMMINKRLKDLVCPIPHNAIMHDWWIALVASIHSGIYHIDQSTILYRQHDGNNIGANKYSLKHFIKNYHNYFYDSIYKTIKQGEQLSSRYRNYLNKEQLIMLNSFIRIFDKNRLNRLIDLYKFRFRKHGFWRNLGFFLTTLHHSNEKVK